MSAHEDFSRPQAAPPSSDRSFGLILGAFLAALGLWPALHRGTVRWWALAGSFLLIAAAAIRPGILAPLNRAWTGLGRLLHAVMNPIVTGLLFYAVFVPAGLFFRLRGRDALRLRFDPQAQSYWLPRQPPGPPPAGMANQF